ncbi:hypothetical protein SCATT_16150 [Streptantibioticus cattleyicolor NRRL 8057 = DSM 46488]|uniref:Uncharacterized protein n=1 Tax=Streptantibioticus cattleyicolor (strain ATCC 35852 / DSM 46488 / JCM 4925 / NBRC 14057 / NRRL 8057) TaxID=1003195 RepID=G8WNE0_STREN|nr:hypothetical protein SCATT_16150 [Streptantibioticus cattleyicolor NRRL 8057 = DSM 46488]
MRHDRDATGRPGRRGSGRRRDRRRDLGRRTCRQHLACPAAPGTGARGVVGRRPARSGSASLRLRPGPGPRPSDRPPTSASARLALRGRMVGLRLASAAAGARPSSLGPTPNLRLSSARPAGPDGRAPPRFGCGRGPALVPRADPQPPPQLGSPSDAARWALRPPPCDHTLPLQLRLGLPPDAAGHRPPGGRRPFDDRA